MKNAKIMKWLEEREHETRVYTWFSNSHYKCAFSGGGVYEWKSTKCGYDREHVQTWIDGEMVQNAVYREGWLANGAWGYEKLEDLPLENAA